MDHTYNDTPLLTSSEILCGDLSLSFLDDLAKGFPLRNFGSPLCIDQNATYEDPMINPVTSPSVQNTQEMLPTPPPLEEYGPVPGRRESVHSTTPPELAPSLSPTGTIPSRDVYPGLLEFEIRLDSASSSKKSWLYSHKLNKVFIDMNKSLLIQFHVNEFMNGLFVRALPVYEQDDYVSIPVQRCGLHALNDDRHHKAHPSSQPGVCFCGPENGMVRHVVQCSHPQARYDYNNESDRHSVVVPLQIPHPGSNTTTVEYRFTCSTSCPQGMNRKPIVLIFTLENEQCEVKGRLVLPVKICSCPKRDKDKEEKEREEREKEEENGCVAPRTKRRLSSGDRQKYKKLKTENTAPNDPHQEESHQIEIGLKQIIEDKMTKLEQKVMEKLEILDKKLNMLLDNSAQH